MVNEDLLQPGQIVGRYRVERRIGRGVQTEIYRAREIGARGIVVALKCFHPRSVTSIKPPNPARFSIGIKRLRSLRDETIPNIYNGGVVGEMYWIAMEYIEGTRIADDLAPLVTPYSTLLALLYVRQLACLLHVAHARGVLHGDLKPASVLIVSRYPGIKLLDLGCLELFGWSAETAACAPCYKAPEQLSSGVMDERTDIYALGTILYEMLSLRTPFAEPTGALPPAEELVRRKIHSAPIPIEVWRPEMPDCVRQFIVKCLEKEPDKRFESLDEFLKGMEALERDIPGFRDQLEQVVTRAIDALTARDAGIAPRRTDISLNGSTEERPSGIWDTGERSPLVDFGDEDGESRSGAAVAGTGAAASEEAPKREAPDKPIAEQEPSPARTSDGQAPQPDEAPSDANGDGTSRAGGGPPGGDARSLDVEIGGIEMGFGGGQAPAVMEPPDRPRPVRGLLSYLRWATIADASQGGPSKWRIGLIGLFAGAAATLAISSTLRFGEGILLVDGVTWPHKWPVPDLPLAACAEGPASVEELAVASAPAATEGRARRLYATQSPRVSPRTALHDSDAQTSSVKISVARKECPATLRCRNR